LPLSHSTAVWLWVYSRVVERHTCGLEVAGSTLTHCAVEYSPSQAAHAHLLLSPSSIIWYWLGCWSRGWWCLEAMKVSVGLALHMASVADFLVYSTCGPKIHRRMRTHGYGAMDLWHVYVNLYKCMCDPGIFATQCNVYFHIRRQQSGSARRCIQLLADH